MSNKKSQPKLAERKNPLYNVSTIINNYHSIDMLDGTEEEKRWAKSRLEKELKSHLYLLGDNLRGLVRSSLKSKELWEDIRELYFN